MPAPASDYTLTAVQNLPPEITSTPVTTAAPGGPYRYDVRATDPNGDQLTYELVQAPDGMTIDQLGRITWQPGTEHLGSHNVEIRVTDVAGASASPQIYQINVAPDSLPPKISIGLSENPVAARQCSHDRRYRRRQCGSR